MKQGTTFFMNIRVGMDLDLIEKVRFKFKQDCMEKEFVYPSDEALRNDACRAIMLLWKEEDTWDFNADREIAMDTKITLKDSFVNPQTEIKYFKLKGTLFTSEDEHD